MYKRINILIILIAIMILILPNVKSIGIDNPNIPKIPKVTIGGGNSYNISNVYNNYTEINGSSYNETYQNYVYLNKSNATSFWDDIDSYNSTQMSQSNNVLNILESWVNSVWMSISDFFGMSSNIAWKNQSNVYNKIQNFTNITVIGIYNVSTLCDQTGWCYNLSVMNTSSGGDFSFTNFHSSFVLNSTILNYTNNIVNLLRGTNISQYALNQSAGFVGINVTSNILTLLIGTNISQYALNQSAGFVGINRTVNIQQLYNATASMIANLSATQLSCNATGVCKAGNVAYINFTNVGNFNITKGNITIDQNNTICLNVICSRYILDNGTNVVIQG